MNDDPIQERPRTGRRISYGAWMLRVLTWDAALPTCVAVAPFVLEWLFPGRRGPVELSAVVLPTAAFLFRLRVGKRHIATNGCSAALRQHQLVVSFMGILPLALMECMLMLSGLMPKGALFAAGTDRLAWAVLIAAYLSAMTFAMYPGRASESANPGGRDPGRTARDLI